MKEDKKKDDEKEETQKGRKLTAQSKEEPEEEEGQDVVQDTFSSRVVIHEALHLPVCRTEPRLCERVSYDGE